MSALIAIVGRPNVGKSSLFNRIVGKRIAITSDIAGTTRDRLIQKIQLNDLECFLVDTGGIEDREGTIESNIQAQAKIAIEDANLILFVVDSTSELTRDDFLAADLLRKSNKKVILVLNKAENFQKSQYHEYPKLGLEKPIFVAAIHNIGTEALLQRCEDELKTMGYGPKTTSSEGIDFSISILGRPNVGKSSLVNALIGSDKNIVSDIAGTTRDSTDTLIRYQQKMINLIDTAGIRRRGKIEQGIEKFSILRCMKSITESDVSVLVLNYEDGIAKQDCHIAEYILKENKGLIIAVNKIDLMEEKEEDRQKFALLLKRRFSFLPWVSVIFISAKEKKNIFKIFDLAEQIQLERKKRIPTGQFNNFLQKITHKHLPSGRHKQPPKIYYGSQTGTNPPEFTFFMNDPELLHFSYKRFIENEIRDEYGFDGTSINLIFRQRSRRDLKAEKSKQGPKKGNKKPRKMVGKRSSKARK